MNPDPETYTWKAPAITSSWEKVLVIYEDGKVKAFMRSNGGCHYYEAPLMSHEDVGELHNASPNAQNNIQV